VFIGLVEDTEFKGVQAQLLGQKAGLVTFN